MKKRRPDGTALVPAGKRDLPAVITPKRISKLRNVKRLKSILGDSAEAVHQLLEVGDNESATSLIHKKVLQTLIDVLPYAEATIRKTKGTRGVYQVNSLVSSIREVMLDLQAMQDKGALGEALVEKIIRPSYLDVGMQLIQEYSNIAAEARASMSVDEFKSFKATLARSRSNVAEFVQKEYIRVKDDTKAFLQR